jgi:hypothetical protein
MTRADSSPADNDAAMRTMVAFHGRMAVGARPAVALADATASGDPAVFVCFGAG